MEKTCPIKRLDSRDDDDGTILGCEGKRSNVGTFLKRIVRREEEGRRSKFLEAGSQSLLTA